MKRLPFADFLDRLRRGVRDDERGKLAAILELNRAIAAASDPRDLLARLLDAAVQLFGAERGFVVLAASPADELQIPIARSLDRETIRSPLQKISRTVVKESLQSGQGVFCADAREGDFGAAASIADLKLRSVLCMPLLVGERRLGCIYLDHRFQAGVFRELDLPWFQAFADQGAIALHLHQLVQDSRRRAEIAEQRSEKLEATVAQQTAVLRELHVPLRRTELRHPYDGILGEAPSLLAALHLLDRVIGKDLPILFVGESGTGKELCAQAVHRYGTRSGRAMVPVNLAAIPRELLASELFGHARGAFTGADRERRGLIREADGGVLFLDEVTELDLDLQAKLLRVLEDGMVRPVGSDRTYPVDMRVVAATNRDPELEVEAGRFRRDLYFRLAGITVRLPPLRERPADVSLLVHHFFALAASARGPGEPIVPTPRLLAELTRRRWPGNLRQLRNEVMRLDALAEGGTVDLDALGPEPGARLGERELNLDLLEADALRRALEVSGGNKTEAARLLGISRRALYNKLARLGAGDGGSV